MSYANPDKQRAYAREWMRSRRQAWLTENGPCKRCGSTERLEVDHIDPADKVTHAVWSWSEERRLAELAKCQVLCHACHKEKSKKDVGDQLRGRKGVSRSLSDDKAIEIVKRLLDGEGVNALAREYDLPHSYVSRIKSGERLGWVHDMLAKQFSDPQFWKRGRVC